MGQEARHFFRITNWKTKTEANQIYYVHVKNKFRLTTCQVRHQLKTDLIHSQFKNTRGTKNTVSCERISFLPDFIFTWHTCHLPKHDIKWSLSYVIHTVLIPGLLENSVCTMQLYKQPKNQKYLFTVYFWKTICSKLDIASSAAPFFSQRTMCRTHREWQDFSGLFASDPIPLHHLTTCSQQTLGMAPDKTGDTSPAHGKTAM